jgi:hypothetical protein
MHIDEERIQRLLHGELSRAGEATAREHVAGCAACRERLAEAQGEENEIHALLRALDGPEPRIDVESVVHRADAPDSHRHRGPAPRPGRGRGGRHRSAIRWGAGILLAAIVAGAAYAVPGSPLPVWVHAVVQWIGRSRPSPPGPAPARDRDPDVAGVTVVPGRELVILFTSPQSKGHARVSLTDEAEVAVRAASGAASFTSEVDRLVIGNAGSSAAFEILIPRAAPRIEIRVGGRRIFVKQGDHVITAASPDARGAYLLPLGP